MKQLTFAGRILVLLAVSLEEKGRLLGPDNVATGEEQYGGD